VAHDTLAQAQDTTLTTEPRFPVAHVDTLAQFTRLREKQLEAVIWTRTVPKKVQRWLDKLPARQIPDARFVLNPETVFDCVCALFKPARMTDPDPALWLAQDAARMVQFISEQFDTDWVRLRLDRVQDNACSKFHIDNVTARLICTYRGPGTQLSLDDPSQERIEEVPTGMPILLKGRRWPGSTQPTLRHRSPPIAGTGQIRLLLVLESVSLDEVSPEYDTVLTRDDARFIV